MQAGRHDGLFTKGKASTITDLFFVCMDNLVNLAMKIFKYEMIDKISHLKAFLLCNHDEIKDRERQSSVIVERLTELDKGCAAAPANGF